MRFFLTPLILLKELQMSRLKWLAFVFSMLSMTQIAFAASDFNCDRGGPKADPRQLTAEPSVFGGILVSFYHGAELKYQTRLVGDQRKLIDFYQDLIARSQDSCTYLVITCDTRTDYNRFLLPTSETIPNCSPHSNILH
jgi:hypothetical protein